MREAKIITNAFLRVWIVNEQQTMRKYCIRTSVYRVMFANDKNIRIILRELLTRNPASDSDLLNSFLDGYHIFLMQGQYGRPDDFENNELFLAFYNCNLRRSWMTNVTATQFANVDSVKIFVEVESQNYEWKVKK